MFRKSLAEQLRSIFGFSKVTFNAPSDAFEQDTLFVEVQSCRTRPVTGKVFARVTGTLRVFSQAEKLPFGFFAKRIENADYEDTKNFFFFDVDVNVEASGARLINLHERTVSFVYFFTVQHDPNRGTINSLEWS